MTAQFNDTSIGTPTSWNWSFGDGNYSTAQNPVHAYAYTGTFTVKLNATNAAGSNITTKTNHIIVNIPAPVANFNANVTSGPAPLTIQFNDTSLGSPTSWHWTFGDIGAGNSSTLRNPVHTYMAKGNYTVHLIAGNYGGSNLTIVPGMIRVGLRPNASFFWTPAEPEANQTVTLDASASTDPDGTITGYIWDFNDGTPILNRTTPSAIHTFLEPRVYNVILTVLDNETFPGITIRQVSVFAKKVTIPAAVNGTTSETVGGVQSLVVNATSIGDVGGNVTTTNTSMTMENANEFWQTIEVRASAVNETAPGNITVQDVREVVMESAPIMSVLNESIGNVSVALDIALQQFVENVQIDVKVTQGANATTMHGFQLAANQSGKDILDVAYTVELSNTDRFNNNLTTNATRASNKAVITMSVSHAWVRQYNNGANNDGRDTVYIIRYPDIGEKEVLPTRFVPSKSDTTMDWFEADSQYGFSIFGLVTAAVQQAHEQAQSPSGSQPSSDTGEKGPVSKSTAPVAAPVPETILIGKGSLPLNPQGVTVRSIGIRSQDTMVLLSIPAGVKAFDINGKAIGELSISTLNAADIRDALAKGDDEGYVYENMAYSIGPNGVQFDPPVMLTFTPTEDYWGRIEDEVRSPVIRYYDGASLRWISVPTSADRMQGTVTASVSHFTTFGLFSIPVPGGVKPSEPTITPAAEKTLPNLPRTLIVTDIGMFGWLLGMFVKYPILIVVATVVIAMIMYFGWWNRRIR
jgi:hypothetical protein